jgi:hypothetical protein
MNTKFRVAHFPQIPCKPFEVYVDSVLEGVKLMDILAEYDKFQFENKIKPDYCSSNVLQMFYEDEQEWLDWEDEETGENDPRQWLEDQGIVVGKLFEVPEKKSSVVHVSIGELARRKRIS